MTDPRDEQFDRQVRELLTAAGGDAPAGNVHLPTRRIGAPAARGRGWMLAAAVAAVVAGAAVLILRNQGDGPEAHRSPPSTVGSDASTPPTALPPPTTAGLDPDVITRPYLDPARCGNGSKGEYVSTDITYVPFALGVPSPIPLQVLAAPTDGVAKPFAVLLRLFGTGRDFSNDHPVLINGVVVYVDVLSNGNGTAAWTLPDGSTGYLRSRGLDQAAIESVVARLSPRDPSAPIPGFDVAPATDGSELVLLHERLNTHFSGTTTLFQCEAPDTGATYRVRAIAGDPVYVYFGIIDVPRPYAVGVNGGGAITIEGGTGELGPTLADVTDADLATWAALPDLPTIPT